MASTTKDTTQIHTLQQEIQKFKDEYKQQKKQQEQIYQRVIKKLPSTVPLPTNKSDNYEKIQQQMELVVEQDQKRQQVLTLIVEDLKTKLEDLMQDGDGDLEELTKREDDLKDDLAYYDKKLEELSNQLEQQKTRRPVVD